MSEAPAHRLRLLTAVFVVAFAVHNADHARRGIAATPEPVVWAGTFVAMLSAVLVTLVLTRHPSAPKLCAVGGLAIAIGVSLSHLPPKWGPLSDPVLSGGRTDALTTIAVSGEILAALALALVALQASRTPTGNLHPRAAHRYS